MKEYIEKEFLGLSTMKRSESYAEDMGLINIRALKPLNFRALTFYYYLFSKILP